MKLSPKQKGFESPEDVKLHRNQYHKIPAELKNEGSPVVMGCDLPCTWCGWWGGLAHGPGPRKAWSSHLPLQPRLLWGNLIFFFGFRSLTVSIILGEATKNFTSFLFAWISCVYVLRRKLHLKSSYHYSSDHCLKRHIGSEPYYVSSLSPPALGLLECTVSPLRDGFLLIFTRCRFAL